MKSSSACSCRRSAELAVQDAAQARLNAQLAAQARSNLMMQWYWWKFTKFIFSENTDASSPNSSSSEKQVLSLWCYDGVVMGPPLAFDNLHWKLQNARGVFLVHGMKLHMAICVVCMIGQAKVVLAHLCNSPKSLVSACHKIWAAIITEIRRL